MKVVDVATKSFQNGRRMNGELLRRQIFDDVMSHFRSAEEVAVEFEISRQSVNKWKDGIPVERCKRLEELTGIPRAKLRPDVFA